jgi:hypothetical protein
MANKKKTPTTSSTYLPTLTIGSRVRCTDDGIEGRIVWANATSVKITWDDGEQVTWRRDSLAGRPIQILDPDTGSDEKRPTEPPKADASPEPATPEQPVAEGVPTTEWDVAPAIPEQPTASESAESASEQTEAASPTSSEPAPVVPAKPKRQRKAPAEPKDKKVSALDAAAKALQEAGTAMTTQEMIDAMASKGYWSSPAGKTPAATLYSAILREITTKGDAARFIKTERGKFGIRTTA